MGFADYLAEAAERARARGDTALTAALAGLPAAAVHDPARYRALVRPVADRIATTDADFAREHEPATVRAELDKR